MILRRLMVNDERNPLANCHSHQIQAVYRIQLVSFLDETPGFCTILIERKTYD